ncbi:hypothetical protein TNCV_3450591 [Trichonephila clavipes]|uniref:Uncharacterized protein n=1 Tax=Trichonephila clavipes TaxID=2585209 RepID=A0A8X6WMD2_TRICX|nr:hypothetical protein TNCV_3450591 [Trichonephila clavipes]
MDKEIVQQPFTTICTSSYHTIEGENACGFQLRVTEAMDTCRHPTLLQTASNGTSGFLVIHVTEDDYLFMDRRSNDGVDETECDDVTEDIMEDEYDELILFSNNM